MIVTEFFAERLDGIKLYRTFSDKGLQILQIETNMVYDEAIDVANSGFTYKETNILIEEE